MAKPVCVIVGVGEGNGAALARAFAREAMAVALLARSTDFTEALASELGDARAYSCDVSDAPSVAAAFASIRSDLGDPTVLVYNAGSGVWGDVETITLGGFESSWRINALGALAASQQVIPAMKAAGSGTIIFIGATASLRGGPRNRGLRSSQGGAAQPRGIDGEDIVAAGNPCRPHRHRCGSQPAAGPREYAGQAR